MTLATGSADFEKVFLYFFLVRPAAAAASAGALQPLRAEPLFYFGLSVEELVPARAEQRQRQWGTSSCTFALACVVGVCFCLSRLRVAPSDRKCSRW